MPKPTFLQSVLGKPSRSYADPYAPSPWAEYAKEDDEFQGYSSNSTRYPSRYRAGGYDEYDEEPVVAGPSRPRRDSSYSATSSQISFARARSVEPVLPPREAEYIPTRFPKAVKKAKSTIVLRETVVADRYADGERPRSVTGGAVKKKKKRATGSVVNGDSVSVVSGYSENSSRRAGARDRHLGAYNDREYQHTPSLVSESQSSIVSSAASSSRRPLSPVIEQPPLPAGAPNPTIRRPKPTAVQKIVAGGTAPITPPASDMSSNRSSREHMDTLATTRPSQDNTSGRTRSDTTRSSKTITQSDHIFEGTEADLEAQGGYVTPIRQQAGDDAQAASVPPLGGGFLLAPPVLMVQPPTPAAVQEAEDSPFHEEQGVDAASIPVPRPPFTPAMSSQSAPAVFDHEGAPSDSGEVGSDGDDESAIEEGSAAGMQNQRNGSSRPPSVIRTAPLPGPSSDYNRSDRGSFSRHTPRTSFSQPDLHHMRRSSIAPSEASVGGRSAREGSIRSGISGYGKGGWAAAAASGSQSGRSSPVKMFLPSGANDGWAEFQVPMAPPRQSRFTPLPPSSQPLTFDRLVNGASDTGSSAIGRAMSERSGAARPGGDIGETKPRARSEKSLPGRPGEGSTPSTYSQGSDSEEDNLPRPSRSYLPSSLGNSHGGMPLPNDDVPDDEEDSGDEWTGPAPSRKYSTGPVPPPKSPRRASTSPHLASSPIFADAARSTQGIAYTEISTSSPRPSASPSRTSSQLEGLNAYPYIPSSGTSPTGSISPSRSNSPSFSRPTSPTPSMRERESFPRPSFLDPDVLTLLPEMTIEDSERLYRSPSEAAPSRSVSVLGHRKASSVINEPLKRPASVIGSAFGRYAKTDVERNGDGSDGEGGSVINIPRRAKSSLGIRREQIKSSEFKWEGSSYGGGVLMQSDGRDPERVGGYSSIVLPSGAYTPSDPNRKRTSLLDPRVLGLPQTTMATLTLSHSAHRLPDTPAHLRKDLPPPVDFTSQVKPPSKVGSREVLVQVYAVAVDPTDVKAVEGKGKADVGKWIPGRSFVGRCLSVGAEEKEIVRGEIVVGLMDIRKSGVLAEYIICDRRRVTRAPHPTLLTLEQLCLLPLNGIPALRCTRGRLTRPARALILDAHIGTAALVCQHLSRAGINVTALIGGGDGHHDAQTRCLQNGARGVLTGNPAAMMLGLDEDGWDFVFETKGGLKVYEAARRMLKNGGKLVTTVEPDSTTPQPIRAAAKPSGFRTLRAAFGSKRKDTKSIVFEYLPPAGSGEPAVDTGGMDVRDILEEQAINYLRPIVDDIWPFERGMEAFRSTEKTSVIRIIN